MNMVAVPPRRSKRASIIAAALPIFGRDGFVDASVDDIARAAGVAKPTVYNHFGDKAGLFAVSVAEAASRSNDRVSAVIDSVDVRPVDVRAELERLGEALVGCLLEDEGVIVMRLQFAERNRFPELLDQIRDGNMRRTVDRLAGKLARMSAAGSLDIAEPDRAARHLIALVSDDLLARSGFGAVKMHAREVSSRVRDGVDTFLAAFGGRPARL